MTSKKPNPKVLVASDTFQQQEKPYYILKEAGCEIIDIPASAREQWTENDLINALENIDGLIIGGEHSITKNVIKSSKKLKVISLNCGGYNHVDVKSASEMGVVVCNVTGLSGDTVADFIWGQILSLMRKIVKGDKAIRSNNWDKGVESSCEVSGKTIGIIGLGAIGKKVAQRAVGFNMEIYANDVKRSRLLEERFQLTYTSKEKLLKNSDIVVLCCPLTSKTKNLIGEAELNMMKPNSYLINTMRGAIVEDKALYKALNEKQISGAAIDVFRKEPLYNSKFFVLDNVVLTPHLGGRSDKAILDVAVQAAKNMVLILQGQKTENNILNLETFQDNISS